MGNHLVWTMESASESMVPSDPIRHFRGQQVDEFIEVTVTEVAASRWATWRREGGGATLIYIPPSNNSMLVWARSGAHAPGLSERHSLRSGARVLFVLRRHLKLVVVDIAPTADSV
jgi:hypothetical protein